ncbi:MAG: hypothetical protein VB858_12065 [Planctomycetaceae bacterium]
MNITGDIPVSIGGYGSFTADGHAVVLTRGKATAGPATWNEAIPDDSFKEISIAPTRWAGFSGNDSPGACIAEQTAATWDLKTIAPVCTPHVAPWPELA